MLDVALLAAGLATTAQDDDTSYTESYPGDDEALAVGKAESFLSALATHTGGHAGGHGGNPNHDARGRFASSPTNVEVPGTTNAIKIGHRVFVDSVDHVAVAKALSANPLLTGKMTALHSDGDGAPEKREIDVAGWLPTRHGVSPVIHRPDGELVALYDYDAHRVTRGAEPHTFVAHNPIPFGTKGLNRDDVLLWAKHSESSPMGSVRVHLDGQLSERAQLSNHGVALAGDGTAVFVRSSHDYERKEHLAREADIGHAVASLVAHQHDAGGLNAEVIAADMRRAGSTGIPESIAARVVHDHLANLIRERLTPAQEEAVNHYFSNGYRELNSALRSETMLTPKLATLTEHLDRAIAESPPLTHDVHVLRSYESLPHPLTVGQILRNDNFASTTTNERVAEAFGGHRFRVLLPKGTKAIVSNPAESEILLGRGVGLEVTKVSKSHGVTIYEAKAHIPTEPPSVAERLATYQANIKAEGERLAKAARAASEEAHARGTGQAHAIAGNAHHNAQSYFFAHGDDVAGEHHMRESIRHREEAKRIKRVNAAAAYEKSGHEAMLASQAADKATTTDHAKLAELHVAAARAHEVAAGDAYDAGMHDAHAMHMAVVSQHESEYDRHHTVLAEAENARRLEEIIPKAKAASKAAEAAARKANALVGPTAKQTPAALKAAAAAQRRAQAAHDAASAAWHEARVFMPGGSDARFEATSTARDHAIAASMHGNMYDDLLDTMAMAKKPKGKKKVAKLFNDLTGGGA